MFKAVKFLNKKVHENSYVYDEEGHSVTNKQAMYNIINKHFKEHFQKADAEKIPLVESQPKKLNKPFTQMEVTKTVMMMNNNKATGKDNIPVELIKYAPVSLYMI